MWSLQQAINYGKSVGVKYVVKNSNGGILGGTTDIAIAEQMKAKFQEEYRKDRLNKDLKVFIVQV